jgi:hypothetical protein
MFQVDAGLRFENRKQKYQHMFDVKTPKRVYYLVAESEEDMNKWVEYICHVCGLKAYKDEDGMSVDNPEVLLIKLLIIFLLYWHKVNVQNKNKLLFRKGCTVL